MPLTPCLCSTFNHLYGFSTLWICTRTGLLQEDFVGTNEINQLLFPKYSPILSSLVMSQMNCPCLSCTNTLPPSPFLIFLTEKSLYTALFRLFPHSILYCIATVLSSDFSEHCVIEALNNRISPSWFMHTWGCKYSKHSGIHRMWVISCVREVMETSAYTAESL